MSACLHAWMHARKPSSLGNTPTHSLGPSSFLQQLQTEVRIHRTLRHRHIVRFHHFFEDQHCAYILLELCPNNVRPPVSRDG